MLTELALGTICAYGYSKWQDYQGIWPLKRTWDALGLRVKFSPSSKWAHVPLIVSNRRTSYGRRVVVHLPSGISIDTFMRHVPHMEEQMRATIQTETYHSTVVMEIITTPFPTDVPYELCRPNEKYLLSIPVGQTGTGLLFADLGRMPNLLVAGIPGTGKSNFLHGLCVSLLNDGARLAIIDLKRVEYHYLSHCAVVADTESLALALLTELNTECDRRLALLKKSNLVHAKDLRGQLPWIVLVIDELAELNQKAAQEALERLCRLARAAGICVVCSTQRPSHTLYARWTDARTMFGGRMCFFVPSGEDSRMVVGDDSASRLPRHIAGRAIFQWQKTQLVQVMHLPVSDARNIVRSFSNERIVSLEQHAKVLQP